MVLGIIGAMSEELEILLKDMSLEDVQVKANMKFHKGKNEKLIFFFEV